MAGYTGGSKDPSPDPPPSTCETQGELSDVTVTWTHNGGEGRRAEDTLYVAHFTWTNVRSLLRAGPGGWKLKDATDSEHTEQVIVADRLFFSFFLFCHTLATRHPQFLSSVYGLSSPSQPVTIPYFRSLLTATFPPPPPRTKHKAVLAAAQKGAPANQRHACEVILLTRMQRICDNISSGLKQAAAAHGDLFVILVWGKTYKNKDEC